ncbi:hypothetical protein GF369_02145 [Candidatus Peregrinibacteria bacterium]|nr:hypothetical protein [Candidatus Peregrinibacteria bacterium]
MKRFLKKSVLSILAFLAKRKLKTMRASIVGITGSVGKTSCKDLVAHLLETHHRVLKSEKSYNSEFGLLLTILQQKSGFSSPVQWLVTLFKAFGYTFFNRETFDYLILEMGVDKSGDMDYLTHIAPPDIAIITAIKPVHLDNAQFSSIEDVFREKKKIVSRMKPDGTAYLSLDDNHIKTLSDDKEHNHILYSQKKKADVWASDIRQTEEGLSFTVHYGDEDSFTAFVPLYGEYQLSIVLPAIIAARETGIPVQTIQETLKGYHLPPGRMTLIEGIDNLLLLDSSYNASPEAVKEALHVLHFFGTKRGARRVFIFGNMNELGDYSKSLHQDVGRHIPSKADVLITVGEDVHYAAETALKNGMPSKHIIECRDVHKAIERYREIKKPGDVVLAKGSQNNVRLECFVEAFMLRPEEAQDTLVRQGKNWENIAP